MSKEEIKKAIPEPFETSRLNEIRKAVAKDSPYERKYADRRKPMEIRQPAGVYSGSPESGKLSEHDAGVQNIQPVNQTGHQPDGKNEKVILNKKFPENGVSDCEKPEDADRRNTDSSRNMLVTDVKGMENLKKQTAVTTEGQSKTETQGAQPADQINSSSQQAVEKLSEKDVLSTQNPLETGSVPDIEKAEQMKLEDLLEETPGQKLLDKSSVPYHKILGQLFDTYWLVEFQDQLYMIDQHAAHEKVLYERTMADYRKKEFTSQYVSPPIVLSLTMQEEVLMKKYMHQFEQLGFEIEPFGGKEYAIRAVPDNLYGLDGQELVIELMDGLGSISDKDAPELVMEKVASMSCKAAVKGNQKLSRPEIEALIGELLTLENPYHCPHGRPVIVSMSRYEIEKKFKRVL